jgi:pyruvate kinase
MKPQKNKTKIVCTIGPASESPEIMKQMIEAGMNIARLNFSYGDFATHKRVIEHLRAASAAAGRRVTLMADLPGPKMRIGMIAPEPVELKPGDTFTLTTDSVIGDGSRASVSFPRLPSTVKPGDALYLNDGFIELEVAEVRKNDVICKIRVGGELRSRKGLNLPGIDLGLRAFTDQDHEWLRFAKEQNVDAISQSFVESGADMAAVREAAVSMEYRPFLIAKIERSKALDQIDRILEETDGMMIARGDLGVEIPIEEIAVAQKQLMRKANMLGKPVITATQMLESMTDHRRPTRAEATDVANAVLDGTDCVMLSAESATGKYPVESVTMLASIARAIEPHRPSHDVRDTLTSIPLGSDVTAGDLISLSVENVLQRMDLATVLVPSRSGATVRRLARLRLPVWITAVSASESTCQGLQLSYGVHPVHEPEDPENWSDYAREWVRAHNLEGRTVLLIQGPSPKHPEANHRMEIVDLKR